LVVSREYGRLIISSGGKMPEHFAHALPVPGTLDLSEIRMSVVADFPERSFLPADFKAASREEAYFDFDQIHPPLSVRNRRSGDRIRPLGMRGERKLKDIFIDDKIPRSERERIPLLADSEGILWIIGNRRSERAIVTAETKQILRIRATSN
jgi:tRNA(Ile)-lysidine synthase